MSPSWGRGERTTPPPPCACPASEFRSSRSPAQRPSFLLDSDEVSTGRHPNSDIFLDDVTVSRKHATFRRVGDDFLVRDVGSLNGTYVNRERIDETALQTRDEVQIGKFRLVFYAGASQ